MYISLMKLGSKYILVFLFKSSFITFISFAAIIFISFAAIIFISFAAIIFISFAAIIFISFAAIIFISFAAIIFISFAASYHIHFISVAAMLNLLTQSLTQWREKFLESSKISVHLAKFPRNTPGTRKREKLSSENCRFGHETEKSAPKRLKFKICGQKFRSEWMTYPAFKHWFVVPKKHETLNPCAFLGISTNVMKK